MIERVEKHIYGNTESSKEKILIHWGGIVDKILSSDASELEPAAESSAWAGESGSAPVLRRLRQNREKRNSRLRASALIISQADWKKNTLLKCFWHIVLD